MCYEKTINEAVAGEALFPLNWKEGVQEFATETQISDLFSLSDTNGCDRIPFFDIVMEDGSVLETTSELGLMLGLGGRDYKSLKFNTDLPVEAADSPLTRKYTFGIKAGFHKVDFPTKVKKVSVEIHFTTCKTQTITPIAEEKFIEIEWKTGLLEIMTEDQIKGLFQLSPSARCPAITTFEIIKQDNTNFAPTDPADLLSSYLDLANRNYKSLKFNTDLPTLPPNNVFNQNFTFNIRAGFNYPGYPQEIKLVTVGVAFSLCKIKTIIPVVEEKFF